MEYTEEVKKEADSVLKIYSNLADTYGDESIHCAIQDRQSVLEQVKIFEDDLYFEPISYDYLVNRLQSITQQIEYLKNKL